MCLLSHLCIIWANVKKSWWCIIDSDIVMKANIMLLLKLIFYDKFVRFNLWLMHISGSVATNYLFLDLYDIVHFLPEHFSNILIQSSNNNNKNWKTYTKHWYVESTIFKDSFQYTCICVYMYSTLFHLLFISHGSFIFLWIYFSHFKKMI